MVEVELDLVSAKPNRERLMMSWHADRKNTFRLTESEQALFDLYREFGRRYANAAKFCRDLGVNDGWLSRTLAKYREIEIIQGGMDHGKVVSLKRSRGHATVKDVPHQ